ncbi:MULTISPECIES: hypothetical protein [unclassified Streptomyces]|uniref:hypothetical protein n=1 Tax=unclassified Streptomyces TaxID=2593676 RepID=UPI0005609EEE|nr:hypothetical protein [Streptomyces sp. NRRL F-5727]
MSDEDGRDCARRQPGDVWFLAGTFGTEAKRRCTVPAGVPLAFPLVNSYAVDKSGCAGFMVDAAGSATLDGKELAARRIDAAPIVVTGLEGNAVTGEAGSVLAQGCGIWVQVPAPAEGRHVLEINGRSGEFGVGVVYELTVAG